MYRQCCDTRSPKIITSYLEDWLSRGMSLAQEGSSCGELTYKAIQRTRSQLVDPQERE